MTAFSPTEPNAPWRRDGDPNSSPTVFEGDPEDSFIEEDPLYGTCSPLAVGSGVRAACLAPQHEETVASVRSEAHPVEDALFDAADPLMGVMIIAYDEESGLPQLDEPETSDLPSGGPMGLSEASNDCEYGYAGYWKATGNTVLRPKPVQKIWARDRSSLRYEWNNTKNTKIEVVVHLSPGPVTAGMSYSNIPDMEVGGGGTYGNGSQHIVKVEWRHWEYRWTCRSTACEGPSCGPADEYGTFRYKYAPQRVSGGTWNSATDDIFKCNTDFITWVGNESYAAKTSAVGWGGAFAIWGVKLDVSQQNSNRHRLTIIPDSTQPGQRARYCGRGSDIAYAKQVKEMPR